MPHLDFNQPPFDVLSAAERQSIKKNTQVRYLAKDETLSADDLQYFYVVLKGHIEQLLDNDFIASYLGSNHTEHINSSDWFDSRRSPKSLIEDRAQEDRLQENINIDSSTTSYQFRAVEDTLLLQVNGATIDKIGAQNHFVRQL
jgi:CBS domain-containing protein